MENKIILSILFLIERSPFAAANFLLSSGLFFVALKGLSHEIDFKNFDKKLHNLA
jgi:hypothetical protein